MHMSMIIMLGKRFQLVGQHRVIIDIHIEWHHQITRCPHRIPRHSMIRQWQSLQTIVHEYVRTHTCRTSRIKSTCVHDMSLGYAWQSSG
jgi:hypothetical protein